LQSGDTPGSHVQALGNAKLLLDIILVFEGHHQGERQEEFMYLGIRSRIHLGSEILLREISWGCLNKAPKSGRHRNLASGRAMRGHPAHGIEKGRIQS